MKKILVLMLLSFVTLVASAQSYKVYSVQGKVTVQGKPVKERQAISGSQTMTIPAGAKIILFDHAHKRLATLKTAGTGKVSALVQKAGNNVKQLSGSYLAFITKKMTEGSKSGNTYMQSAGTAYRDFDGLMDESSDESKAETAGQKQNNPLFNKLIGKWYLKKSIPDSEDSEVTDDGILQNNILKNVTMEMISIYSGDGKYNDVVEISLTHIISFKRMTEDGSIDEDSTYVGADVVLSYTLQGTFDVDADSRLLATKDASKSKEIRSLKIKGEIDDEDREELQQTFTEIWQEKLESLDEEMGPMGKDLISIEDITDDSLTLKSTNGVNEEALTFKRIK